MCVRACVCDSEATRVVYSRSDRSIALPSRENGTMLSRSPRSASRKGGHEISWVPIRFFTYRRRFSREHESLMVTKMTGRGYEQVGGEFIYWWRRFRDFFGIREGRSDNDRRGR